MILSLSPPYSLSHATSSPLHFPRSTGREGRQQGRAAQENFLTSSVLKIENYNIKSERDPLLGDGHQARLL